MGKKSKKKIGGGKAAPTKAELKALAAREAELAAEIKRREKKAAKKGKGKKKPEPVVIEKVGKGKKAKTRVAHIPEPTAADIAIAEARAARAAARAAKKAEPSDDRTKPLGGDDLKAALEADTEAGKKRKAEKKAATEDVDAEIRARVLDKRAQREALAAEAEAIDRSDADAVREYNARAVTVGATLLTSDDERKKMSKAAKGKGKKAADDADPAALPRESVGDEAPAHVAEVVETEHGREIAVGPAEPEDFAKPSEAPRRIEDNTNGNGQYKIKRPADGKEVGYTRVTTFIDCLSDRSMLEKWKMRIVLEGVAAIEEAGDDTVTARVRDLVHNRDVALAKARKDDRKGKLGIGELEARTTAAWSTFKKALDALADEVFEVGGGREKAAKGTDIHALCAIAAKDGIDVIGEKLTAGEITPADLADVEAFLAALAKLEAKVVGIEVAVVDDDNKIAGRLDYILMLKLPGMLRSSRVVTDLKTGRIDLDPGKIAMQLEKYSGGAGYDEATGERTDLKLNRTKAIVIHLPAGSGKASAHIVDLSMARVGNKLATEVRSWRNTSKKAIDTSVDLLSIEASS